MRMFACAAVLAALVAPAEAEGRYDRKLEEAVKARIAEKIGEIRGGFEHDRIPEFVQPDALTTGALAPVPFGAGIGAAVAPRQRSLILAIDAKPLRSAF